jgi:hypothetical protein
VHVSASLKLRALEVELLLNPQRVLSFFCGSHSFFRSLADAISRSFAATVGFFFSHVPPAARTIFSSSGFGGRQDLATSDVHAVAMQQLSLNFNAGRFSTAIR